LRAVGLSRHAHVIGKPATGDQIALYRDGRQIWSAARDSLHQLWSETSYRIAALRDDPDCAREAFEDGVLPKDPGLRVQTSFDPSEDIAAPFIAQGARPRVAGHRQLVLQRCLCREQTRFAGCGRSFERNCRSGGLVELGDSCRSVGFVCGVEGGLKAGKGRRSFGRGLRGIGDDGER
jgi:hypothetical protein